MKLDLPIIIDRYKILAHLDSGGMADVYLAYDRLENKKTLAVIKVLKEKFRHEQEVRVMFQDEARLLDLIDHPNVVRFLESGMVQQRPFHIMEYLAGDNLAVLAKAARKHNERLSISLVTRISLQAANALDYIHNLKDENGKSLHLVHRDISPQNILVTYDGRIKLLDFGIAWTEDRSVVTRTGLLKGKLRYMSPEQIESRALDARSDLFSLGIVMWELLTDQKLFKADSEFQTMKKICERPIPSLAQYRDDLPVTLEAVVMGLLRRDPADRYQSAAQLRASLGDILRQDCPGSRPDEITRNAARFLSDRKAQKEKGIRSINANGPIRKRIFGHLDNSEEISQTSSAKKGIGYLSASAPNQGNGHDQKSQVAKKSLLISKELWAIFLIALLTSISITIYVFGNSKNAYAPAQRVGSEESTVADSGILDGPDTNASGDESIAGKKPPDTPDTFSHDGGQTLSSDSAEAHGATRQDQGQQSKDSSELPERAKKPAMGFLTIKTEPKTKVFIDGEYIGDTPVEDMKLEPGKYTVTMIGIKDKIEKKINIVIRAQQVTSQQFIF